MADQVAATSNYVAPANFVQKKITGTDIGVRYCLLSRIRLQASKDDPFFLLFYICFGLNHALSLRWRPNNILPKHLLFGLQNAMLFHIRTFYIFSDIVRRSDCTKPSSLPPCAIVIVMSVLQQRPLTSLPPKIGCSSVSISRGLICSLLLTCGALRPSPGSMVQKPLQSKIIFVL